MNLEQTIKRILMEEINSSSLSPYIKRRVDLSDEKIKKVLKTEILTDKDINADDEFRLNKIIDNTTGELLNWVNQEEYDDNYDSVYQYIKNNYSDFILQYFREIFKDDEEAKFCFIKHSERYGGRGFTDCFGSWFSFLNGYGSWLPNVDWNKVKEELKTKDRILLARPLEGHIYEYYFSVLKK